MFWSTFGASSKKNILRNRTSWMTCSISFWSRDGSTLSPESKSSWKSVRWRCPPSATRGRLRQIVLLNKGNKRNSDNERPELSTIFKSVSRMVIHQSLWLKYITRGNNGVFRRLHLVILYEISRYYNMRSFLPQSRRG